MSAALTVHSEPEGESLNSLLLNLSITDPEVRLELESLPLGPIRQSFALQALRIGVLAMKQARGQIDGEQIRREGERLLIDLEHRLSQHSQLLDAKLNGTLKDYFDPQSGRFQERVERLIKRDGELEQVLRRNIGDEESDLTRTLLQHFGESSPLLKWLSPDQSRGLLRAFQTLLDEQLKVQRDHVLSEFSLNNKEGALCRLVGELNLNQTELTQQLQTRIDEVVKQFSLNDEDSALSRLVNNVDRAQREITREFSLDHEKSALSRLKLLLEQTNSAIEGHLSLDEEDSALARLRRELLQLLENQRETSQRFQEEIKLSLQAMTVRKEEAARSTRHGLAFEAHVVEFLTLECQKLGDLVEATGMTTGQRKNSKVGDAVIELGAETAAPGARIVVEAKEDASYNLAKARIEAEIARENRGAQMGIFVFSRKTAPATIEPLSRHGSDIFAVWDAEDPQSDLVLKTAITLARALCVRMAVQSAEESADLLAIEQISLNLEKHVSGLEEITKWITTIANNSEHISKKAKSMREALVDQVEDLKNRTLSLRATRKS